jgi:hypothetical protein
VTTSARQLPPEIKAAPFIWRQLFHLIPGSFVPVAGIFAPQEMMAIAFGALAFVSLSLDLLRVRASVAEPALYSLAGAALEKARRPSDYRRYLHGDCGVY